jgi:phosphatidylserine synthase
MVRAKDLATLGNAASGLAAILLCVQGRPSAAAFAILVGYMFDIADGAIARKLSGSNRFGAELDNLADHMTFGIAPAYCIYLAYRPVAPWLGVVLGGVFALAATLRHTRNLVYQVPTTLCWVGMPRPAAAFVAVAFLHSRLFETRLGPWLGVALTLGLAAAVLSTWPFVNHRGRRLQWWARGFVVAWAGSWIATGLLARAYFWDVVLGWAFGYSVASWLALTPDERRAFFVATRAWKRGIAQGAAQGA